MAEEQRNAEATASIEALTPRQVVAELDRFIVGQTAAKRAVAIALRNRYRRSRLSEEMRDEVIPKNILMIGPTGVGKTEIARRLAKLAHAPFLKIEATKFTEVGYVGRDVDSMVRDLVQISIRLVESEMMEAVREKAEEIAIDRIVEILHPRKSKAAQAAEKFSHTVQEQVADFERQLGAMFGGRATVVGTARTPAPEPDAEPTPPTEAEAAANREQAERDDRIRHRLREQVQSGGRDDEEIEIEVEDSGGNMAMIPIFGGGPGGGPGDDSGMDIQSLLSQIAPKRRKPRRMPIRDARKLLTAEAARGLIDSDAVTREAIRRAEESGIIFLDEIDKVAGRGGGAGEGRGPDVSREGVQRDLLPIIEGSTVQTRFGPVRTNYVLFIAAGAFHVSKPSDLIPELQGRLPIRVELESLTEDDFRRILTEPRNSLTRQYEALLATEGITVTFTDDAIHELARLAVDLNTRTENIGARRLATVMERLLEDLSFDAPDSEAKTVLIDAAVVRDRVGGIAEDEDLSRYIL